MQINHFLKSAIFRRAKFFAGATISNRLRLIALIGAVGKKLSEVDNKKKIANDLKEKIFLSGRLLKATVIGRYSALPWKSALSIAAALIYFINPADIVPDIIPISGLLDDFTILLWTYNSLSLELEQFKQWEMTGRDQE